MCQMLAAVLTSAASSFVFLVTGPAAAAAAPAAFGAFRGNSLHMHDKTLMRLHSSWRMHSTPTFPSLSRHVRSASLKLME